MVWCLFKHRDNFRSRVAQWYSAETRTEDWGFVFRQGLGIFLFTTVSRPALAPTQTSIQWVQRDLSLG